jgi:hypothetical protein
MKKLLLATAIAALCSATAANAVEWTNWTSGTVGSVAGSATGTMGGVTVTYTGEMECLNCYASNWSPASTWANVPPPGDSGIQLSGGNGSVVDTITFSAPVVNPTLAIISLGQGGLNASFNFTSSEPFSLAGGGPSTAWGGQALTSVGDIVYGQEGNGLVVFEGTYSSISWTNPVYENYYAVTVGTVPEISTWTMMMLGFAGLGFVGYRKSGKVVSVAG